MQTGRLSGVDVFEETDRFTVIVELPGAEKDDISVNLQTNALDIVAYAGTREYRRHIDLGFPVKSDPVITGNNGIFEIVLGKV
jgi:HSP20 family molecular chaperone IbpA